MKVSIQKQKQRQSTVNHETSFGANDTRLTRWTRWARRTRRTRRTTRKASICLLMFFDVFWFNKYWKISQTPGIMTIKMPNGVACLAHNKCHLVLCMVPLLKDEACLGSASGYGNFSETVRWQPLSQICSSQSLQHKL